MESPIQRNKHMLKITKHKQLEIYIIIHITYCIEHKSVFYINKCQNISFISRALCQIKTCILRNKSVTVILPEIVASTSCNVQVLYMCMVLHIIRTLHTNLSTCYVCVQLYANVTHHRCHVLHMRTVVIPVRICNAFVTYSYV